MMGTMDRADANDHATTDQLAAAEAPAIRSGSA
jgi:hypothetical protein